jgi:hypothetical protein
MKNSSHQLSKRFIFPSWIYEIKNKLVYSCKCRSNHRVGVEKKNCSIRTKLRLCEYFIIYFLTEKYFQSFVWAVNSNPRSISFYLRYKKMLLWIYSCECKFDDYLPKIYFSLIKIMTKTFAIIDQCILIRWKVVWWVIGLYNQIPEFNPERNVFILFNINRILSRFQGWYKNIDYTPTT